MKKGRSVIVAVVIAIILLLAAIAVPSFIKARNTSCQNACINNLRQIDSGKEQWALAKRSNEGVAVVVAEVNEYIKGSTTPICPQGGTYTYNNTGVNPECSGVTKDKYGPPVRHALPIGK